MKQPDEWSNTEWLHVLCAVYNASANRPSQSNSPARASGHHLCHRGCRQHSALLVELGVTRYAAADADAAHRRLLITERLHIMQHVPEMRLHNASERQRVLSADTQPWPPYITPYAKRRPEQACTLATSDDKAALTGASSRLFVIKRAPAGASWPCVHSASPAAAAALPQGAAGFLLPRQTPVQRAAADADRHLYTICFLLCTVRFSWGPM